MILELKNPKNWENNINEIAMNRKLRRINEQGR